MFINHSYYRFGFAIMSYNVCIHQSLQKRIIDEVEDAMKRFINHFDDLLRDLDETQQLFQLDDCQMLMQKGDDEPYCQLYRNQFRTLNGHLNEVWNNLELATTALYPLRETSIYEKESSSQQVNHLSSSIPVETNETSRELEVTNHIFPPEVEKIDFPACGVTDTECSSLQDLEKNVTCENLTLKRDLHETNVPDSKKVKI